MAFWVYILASQRNGTLYVGHTDDLWRRITEHKAHSQPGFSAKYGVTRLVWYQEHETRHEAFTQKRRMKKWRRLWKLELIERVNPGWRDLFEELNERKSLGPRFRGDERKERDDRDERDLV